MKNHQKIDAEVALCHLFFDFKRFGEWPKKHDFLMPLWWAKNPENRSRNGPEAFSRQEAVVKGIPPGAPGPWGGHARAIAISLRNKAKGIKPKA